MILNFLDRILCKLKIYGEEYGFPYVLFSCYMLFNYIGFYPWWIITTKNAHFPFLKFHIVSFLFVLALSLKKFWPTKLLKFYTLLWYITLIWCLPFSNAFFLFHKITNPNTVIIDDMLAIFTLILIVDWLSFVIILISGILCAWLVQHYIYGSNTIHLIELRSSLFTILWAICIGILFSRNSSRYRQNFQLQKQLSAVRTVCASIAHELRTPLLSIKGGANGIKIFIPRLLAGYKAAAEAKLNVPRIFPSQIKQIEQVIANIESEVDFSNTVIDTLLLNATQIAINPQVYTPNSMSHCIKAALLRYPFNPSAQLELVHFNEEHNFTYHGDDLLMTHVIFNLLKNALYAISETQKGEIFIWLTNEPKYNYVHFKDTAKGITKEEQAKLFEPFNSNTPVGTGIGLSFCRMVMQNLGGDIELHTKMGDFAEFVLKFPTVDANVKEMIKKPS